MREAGREGLARGLPALRPRGGRALPGWGRGGGGGALPGWGALLPEPSAQPPQNGLDSPGRAVTGAQTGQGDLMGSCAASLPILSCLILSSWCPSLAFGLFFSVPHFNFFCPPTLYPLFSSAPPPQPPHSGLPPVFLPPERGACLGTAPPAPVSAAASRPAPPSNTPGPLWGPAQGPP